MILTIHSIPDCWIYMLLIHCQKSQKLRERGTRGVRIFLLWQNPTLEALKLHTCKTKLTCDCKQSLRKRADRNWLTLMWVLGLKGILDNGNWNSWNVTRKTCLDTDKRKGWLTYRDREPILPTILLTGHSLLRNSVRKADRTVKAVVPVKAPLKLQNTCFGNDNLCSARGSGFSKSKSWHRRTGPMKLIIKFVRSFNIPGLK